MNRLNYGWSHSLKKSIESGRHHHIKVLASDVRIRCIKFMSDKERKISSFSGKVDKMEIPAKDFETGHDIPDRYVTWYVYPCYNITIPNPQDINGPPSLRERGTKDARIILHYLSKGITVLQVVGNEQSGSKTTPYLISPRWAR